MGLIKLVYCSVIGQKHSLDSIVERYTTTMPRKVIITRHIRVLRMGTLVQSRCCPVEERLRGGQYGEIQR